MKPALLSGLVASLLLLVVPASAGTVTVSQRMDYQDNYNEWLFPETDPNRTVFAPPWASIDDVNNPDVIDHLPYYRNELQCWGWTHDITARIPADAIGIQSATLTIDNWDVNASADPPEIDRIYANNVLLGALNGTPIYDWGQTTFSLPATVINDLWIDGTLYIYMDIDVINDIVGHRVTLGSSTLTVTYNVSGEGRGDVQPIFRFWSSVLGRHFYTTSESERDFVMHTWPDTWTDYEGVGYYLPVDETDPNVMPVYRFWSSLLASHFYTISEQERDSILATYPTYIWELEGVVFYAYPAGQQPAGTKPVYRFWSDVLGTHFYTIDEAEKDYILLHWPHAWEYESIAWYAYDN